jgi:hypothetical protein
MSVVLLVTVQPESTFYIVIRTFYYFSLFAVAATAAHVQRSHAHTLYIKGKTKTARRSSVKINKTRKSMRRLSAYKSTLERT